MLIFVGREYGRNFREVNVIVGYFRILALFLGVREELGRGRES